MLGITKPFTYYCSKLSLIDPCPHCYFTRAHNHRCYTYSYRYSYTWTEADDICQILGGQLLASETEKEFYEFKDWYFTGNVSVMVVWIEYFCKIYWMVDCNFSYHIHTAQSDIGNWGTRIYQIFPDTERHHKSIIIKWHQWYILEIGESTCLINLCIWIQNGSPFLVTNIALGLMVNEHQRATCGNGTLMCWLHITWRRTWRLDRIWLCLPTITRSTTYRIRKALVYCVNPVSTVHYNDIV